MRAVIAHPNLQLVGVRVYSEFKAGKDAGALCGLPPTGVFATRNLEDILALKPDCVLYMPESTNIDDVCRLLESGSTSSRRAEFFNSTKMDAFVSRSHRSSVPQRQLLHPRNRQQSRIHHRSTSIVLTSIARRLDFLLIDEFANCIDACSEEMLLK
jgi:4-hydroxy-tetrahydrodipicolinate reductase